MAKKKPSGAKSTPKGFHVKMTPEERAAWAKIAEIEERELSVVITRALRLYAQKNGYEWPDTQAQPINGEA